MKVLKRFAIVALPLLLVGGLTGATVSALGNPAQFNLTVDPSAPFANPFNTAITVSGSYSCSGITPTNGSIQLQLYEIQNNTVVWGQGGMQGGGGPGGPGFVPNCDGVTHQWSTPILAFFGPIQFNGGGGGGNVNTLPVATWQPGKAVVLGQGFVQNGDCQSGGTCAGTPGQLPSVVTIGK